MNTFEGACPASTPNKSMYSGAMKNPKRRFKASKPPKRFAVGTPVRVINPGIDGVVTQVDEERTVLSQYWHTVQTKLGERHEPGSILELIPPPIGLPAPRTGKLAENIHFHGANARLNVDSVDRSTNAVSMSQDRLFLELHEKAMSIAEEASREEITRRINEMQKAHMSSGFLQAYQNFVATAANHMTLFAPLLPMLTQLLSSHGL